MKAWFLTLGLLCWAASTATQCKGEVDLRVAVVGAGIGGAAAAYYLRHELGNSTMIDVFEKDKVGGRTQVFTADGKVIEMGASIIHNQNRHFRDLADAMDLQRIEPGAGSKDDCFAIYDGQQFVFNQSSWKVVTLYRMLRRYGLAYFWFQTAPQSLLQKFSRIYSLQQDGRAFETPEALMHEIDLYDLTQHDMRTETERVLGSGTGATRFAKEFIGAVNHINYNQDNGLNAFAGMVSMLPTVDDSLFALEGGNFQLAVKLLQAARVQLRQPAEVTTIEGVSGTYLLHLKDAAVKGPYAAVVLAAPLEQSQLQFTGFEPPSIPARKYQTTVTTIVRGSLAPSFFNVAKVPPGEYIMVKEDAEVPFSVIAPITAYKNGTRLYKLFSSEVLAEEVVASIFQRATVVASHYWKAYPKFNPPEHFARFQLAEGLFYNNAWENAASAMEVAAIEAKNSALLAAKYLQSRRCNPELRRDAAAEL